MPRKQSAKDRTAARLLAGLCPQCGNTKEIDAATGLTTTKRLCWLCREGSRVIQQRYRTNNPGVKRIRKDGQYYLDWCKKAYHEHANQKLCTKCPKHKPLHAMPGYKQCQKHRDETNKRAKKYWRLKGAKKRKERLKRV